MNPNQKTFLRYVLILFPMYCAIQLFMRAPVEIPRNIMYSVLFSALLTWIKVRNEKNSKKKKSE